MLIDEQYGNILAVMCVAVESGLNGGCFGSGVDDKEILLCVWRLGYMLLICVSDFFVVT